MSFISLSCLIALTRSSSIMLNKDGKVDTLRGNVFTFSSLNVMLVMCLSYMALTILSYLPSVPILLRIFLVNEC